MPTADEAVIAEIWRYPVKSLRGECVSSSPIDARGLRGDRLWAVRDAADGKLGSGKNSRRFRPNLVVHTSRPFEEEAWVGRTVRVGAGQDAVELEFTHVLERCVMTSMEQADLPPALGMLKMLGQREDQPLRLAVVGSASRTGVVRTGDPVAVR